MTLLTEICCCYRNPSNKCHIAPWIIFFLHGEGCFMAKFILYIFFSDGLVLWSKHILLFLCKALLIYQCRKTVACDEILDFLFLIKRDYPKVITLHKLLWTYFEVERTCIRYCILKFSMHYVYISIFC